MKLSTIELHNQIEILNQELDRRREIVNAFRISKREIEVKYDNMKDWESCPNPQWQWHIAEYRIKE